MYHEYSRQVGPNAILLFDTEVVLNLEIMTSSIYIYVIQNVLSPGMHSYNGSKRMWWLNGTLMENQKMSQLIASIARYELNGNMCVRR